MQKHLLRVVVFPITLVVAGALHAQSAEHPAYVVDSLQPSHQTSSGHLIENPRRLDARGTPLLDLISKAYDTPATLVFGLDPKVAESRYDIVASYQPKPGEAVKSHELLRNMLDEQFHITAHRENRTVAVYAMTVAPGGIRFFPSVTHDGSINSDDHSFAGYGVTMDFVATDLSGTMRAVVVNRTPLKDRYNLNFSWQPNADNSANIAVIRQAAEQQLGLKLEPTEASVDALVIDHVELAQR